MRHKNGTYVYWLYTPGAKYILHFLYPIPRLCLQYLQHRGLIGAWIIKASVSPMKGSSRDLPRTAKAAYFPVSSSPLLRPLAAKRRRGGRNGQVVCRRTNIPRIAAVRKRAKNTSANRTLVREHRACAMTQISRPLPSKPPRLPRRSRSWRKLGQRIYETDAQIYWINFSAQLRGVGILGSRFSRRASSLGLSFFSFGRVWYALPLPTVGTVPAAFIYL